MKISIHASDLENNRIDGTRVYIFNMLKQIGILSTKDVFFVHHRGKFNKDLEPPKYSNYHFVKGSGAFFWTQTKFAFDVWRKKPDRLWMPVCNMPLFCSRKIKKIVTVHDLAFKYFPDTFTKMTLFKLNFLLNVAVKKSDVIIAISHSTKKDIMNFFPSIDEKKIKVVYHGFDRELFEKDLDEKFVESCLKKYTITSGKYFLYVGAIQPRKNLITLVKAFELVAKQFPDIKLVIAGEKAWKFEETIAAVEKSTFSHRIILTGKIPFDEVSCLYRNALSFVFPEMYAGFGIPLLEAFASKIPVLCANNSSLTEVGGDAPLYFETLDAKELSQKMQQVAENGDLRRKMVAKGMKQIKKFSWEKCAEETIEIIKG